MSTRSALVWLAAILLGSALVAVVLLAYLPPARDAKEAVSLNAPAAPPEPKRRSAPGAVAPAAKQSVTGETTSQPRPRAAKAEESLGIVADKPKEPRPEEQKGLVADKSTGLPVDAPQKPLGVPKAPTLGIVADTPKALYSARTEPKTPEWLAQRGGTIKSQKAVEDGLNWLARHQGQDGHWGADCLGTDPNSRCDMKAPCEGPGQAYEIAQTGLALLAFQAAGHYYFNGQKYSSHVASGLDYFVEEQAPDGSIVGSKNPTPEKINAGAAFHRHFMYEHALGTFALCEACAVAIAEGKKPDPRYQAAAARAVYFIESLQHNDGGWRYTTSATERSDCSVSGWAMLALKTAREAKIDIPQETISRMMAFFASRYADGRTYYLPPNPGTDAMTGVGMMAVEFFEHTLDSPIVQNGAAYLAGRAVAVTQRKVPEALQKAVEEMEKSMRQPNPFGHVVLSPNDYYLWYNCTMAMFQVGGEPWKIWNGAVRDRVISLQVQGQGCDRGSWPTNDQHSGSGGRIYSTSLAVLTLEVYYRFQRVAGQQEMNEFFLK